MHDFTFQIIQWNRILYRSDHSSIYQLQISSSTFNSTDYSLSGGREWFIEKAVH